MEQGFQSLLMVEVSGIEPLPPECDSGTLPTELYPHSDILRGLVEVSGIEPLTLCLQSRCSPS